jgi:hypothetical protein
MVKSAGGAPQLVGCGFYSKMFYVEDIGTGTLAAKFAGEADVWGYSMLHHPEKPNLFMFVGGSSNKVRPAGD